jgi:hypothetical protein
MYFRLKVLVSAVAVCAASWSDAAVYRIEVKAGPVSITLDDYCYISPSDLDDGFCPPLGSYSVTSPSDPVIENLNTYWDPNLVFATAGLLVLEGRPATGAIQGWKTLQCEGVFKASCAFGGSFLGTVGTSGFDLRNVDLGGGAILNDSNLFIATDSLYRWSNSLGTHIVQNGETISTTLSHSNVTLVPVPASLPLMLTVIVAGFGVNARRRFQRPG